MKMSFEIEVDNELSMLLERYKNIPEAINFAFENTLRNHIGEVEAWARCCKEAVRDELKKVGWEIAGEEQDNNREL